jgi:signal transduction histidine kinase
VNGEGYALLGLTALVAAMVAALTFALFRFMAAAGAARQHLRGGGAETALLSSALQDAVSSLKAQERAMSARAIASERLSAQVFDSLTAGLVVVDGAGRVTITNPAARRMLALDEETAGAGYRELLAGVPALAAVLQEGLGTESPVTRRSVQLNGPAGSWYCGVTVSRFGEPGPGRGAICLFSDVTAIIELEQQLQLKEALARLGEMTAGIAHEFRNGLATIHGYSRLLDPQALEPRYRPYVAGIREETDLLGRVLTNFLNFARPEAITLGPVDMQALVQRTIDDLRLELPPSTTLAVAGTFGPVSGDEILLRQTLSNLIRNAAEACELAGTAPMVAVEGRVDSTQQLLLLAVEDNGPGIPEANRTKVFQPFFTTRARGSGLGLAIVQKIVLLHNGRIDIGTAGGGGARIEVALPLANAADAFTRPHAPAQ